MKVILLQDVAKIGKKHSVVDVPDGYGMNKLVPKGMAKPATKANLKRITQQQQEKAAERSQANEAFTTMCEAVSDKDVTVVAKANEDGALYEAVKKDAIQASLAEVAGVAVDLAWIEISAPIKTVGQHTITLVCNDTRVERDITVVAA